MIKRLLAGCGVYLQGEEVLEQVGPALAKKGYRHGLLLAGRKAYGTAGPRLMPGLKAMDDAIAPVLFQGHCTAQEIARYAEAARETRADCVLGLGGGKVMDLAKAVAQEAGLPVFTIPTSAATCAAYAPLSVVYGPQGRQEGIRFFDKEVDGVFVDIRVMAGAPPRLLAAGLADAMAKACEYATMMPEAAYGDLPLGKYLGYRLAQVQDEVIAACALPALESLGGGEVGQALEDAVFCSIASTGMVSGLGGFGGRGGARFAIAHGVNEVLRGAWFPPERWLHGEVVAVGVLAQMAANGEDPVRIATRRELLEKMGVPTRLSQLSPSLAGEGLTAFQEEILALVQVDAAQRETIRKAILSVA